MTENEENYTTCLIIFETKFNIILGFNPKFVYYIDYSSKEEK